MATPPSLGAQDGGGAPRSPIRGGARTRPDTPVLNRLKVTELRALLEGYGESTAGLKSALVERLRLQATSRDAVDAPPASPHDSPARRLRADGRRREEAEEESAAAELLQTLEARRNLPSSKPQTPRFVRPRFSVVCSSCVRTHPHCSPLPGFVRPGHEGKP